MNKPAFGMKMKWLFCCMLMGTLVMIPTNAFSEQRIPVFINGQQQYFQQEPFIENGSTLVPFRPIFEALGVSIDWNDETKTITGTKGSLTVKLTIESDKAVVNGALTNLAVAPRIVEGSTFVPLRFVGEATGYDVSWDTITSSVRITDTATLYPIRNQGVYGFINKDGQIVIEPRFQEVKGDTFVTDLHLIETDSFHVEQAYINRYGEEVIANSDVLPGEKVEFLSTEFTESLARFRKVTNSGKAQLAYDQKVGFINTKGDIVIEPKYDYAGEFHEGLAYVYIGNEYWYVNTRGERAIPIVFEEAVDFQDGFARVKDNGKFGIIDKQGSYIIQPIYDEIGEFRDGIARVQSNGKYGYVNSKGNQIISPQYEDAGDFSEGLAYVYMKDKYGYIDDLGQVVIEPFYDMASEFSEGLAAVGLSGNHGYIDSNGRVIIEPNYVVADEFISGLAFVMDENGNKMYVDQTGKVIIPLSSGMSHGSFDKNGVLQIEHAEEGSPSIMGYISNTGRWIWKEAE
jgi:hypothetical protein